MNRKLLLGVTGGIAAYKSAELVRLLVKEGFEVQVVLTEAAARFVSPLTFEALSGRPAHCDLWEGSMLHIDLARWADLVLVAPASADFLGKVACGLAGDLLSTLCLARSSPLLLAPAMNVKMWENPALQRNVNQLRADGVEILGPGAGFLACGEEGDGRMLEPDEIIENLAAFLSPKVLAGKKVLVTAGPTLEAIDPVRAITNLSSGKMGYAIARAARRAGADVALVSGPTSLPQPAGAEFVPVNSAEEMLSAVMARAGNCDIFISVAAVADYRVSAPSTKKIKKTGEKITLELVPNPDILQTVASLANPPYCVGFAAESDLLANHCEEKRKRKGVPLLVGNHVSALGRDENELVLFEESGATAISRAAKTELAEILVREIASRVA